MILENNICENILSYMKEYIEHAEIQYAYHLSLTNLLNILYIFCSQGWSFLKYTRTHVLQVTQVGNSYNNCLA